MAATHSSLPTSKHHVYVVLGCIRNGLHVLSMCPCKLKVLFFFHVVATHSSLITHHYQLHTVTWSSYHERIVCSKYVILQAKTSVCTWLLLTHHYQLQTATCSSYQERFACSKYVLLETKIGFCTWLLLTHHYQLHNTTCTSFQDVSGTVCMF